MRKRCRDNVVSCFQRYLIIGAPGPVYLSLWKPESISFFRQRYSVVVMRILSCSRPFPKENTVSGAIVLSILSRCLRLGFQENMLSLDSLLVFGI